MEKEREQQVYLARLAEQAERYDGTVIRSSAITFSLCVYMHVCFYEIGIFCGCFGLVNSYVL